MTKIKLPNQEVLEFDKATIEQVAKYLGNKVYKEACAGRLDGKTVDLRTPICKDSSLQILTFKDEEGKRAYWHTAAHVLAQAVKRLFPNAALAIGPAIDQGFYYDFDFERSFTAEDLKKIEAEIKKIIKEDLSIERFELEKDEAIKLYSSSRNMQSPYKLELIEEHSQHGSLSFYQQGEFFDLCAGPHLLSTGCLKAVKLTSCTGAYWRGSEKNKMLQRIYGIAFPKSSELDTYLLAVEEAKKRDHRKIGREQSLFALLDEGPGFPFYLPNGMILKNILIDYWREVHKRAGYHEISTPIMLNRSLWERSGHWGHYQKNMYTSVIDETDFAIKPMNCPGGILVYESKPRSYRDLPLRLGELGIVHRHEKSGTLHGLMRARCFTQDDAHIFMTPEQITDEIKKVVTLIDEVYSAFGFQYNTQLSTMPEDHLGSEQEWEKATSALKDALCEIGREFTINEGDGAFYGPKIDFHLKDSIGRTWQCGTIQLDFQLPERFELVYTGPDGQKHRPVMIHRVVYGSVDRFIGILIEHFAGVFPLWLAPEQIRILPISEKMHEFAKKVETQINVAGLRVSLDSRNEKIGFKIREAQIAKIPYMLIVGENEKSSQSVSVRERQRGDLGIMPISDLISQIKQELLARKSVHPSTCQ